MSTENLHGADWLFNQALDLDYDSRAQFLATACGENTSLRGEVESLLAAHDNADGFLDEAMFAPLPPACECEPSDYVGRAIGPYHLEELIDTGGMGMVFRAVRRGDGFEQQVAIKIIRRDVASPLLVRRFFQERSALANLNHPGIARFIDGGATCDGLPYLVMELISGVPIDRYCDQHRLNVRERLVLFQKVCQAVGHAHQQLIVHRDLKPANILVDLTGQPKLLDFGIAKLLEPMTQQADAQTLQLFRLATPQYASPEQIIGAQITTASDVYSLGVILHELLTGTPPPVTVQNSPGDQPPQVTRMLRGDLNAMVMKAIGSRVEDRYNSVLHFELDIQRFLENRPISARPPSLGRRLVKSIRRNRTAVAALALVLIVLTTATWVSNSLRRRAREAEAAALTDRNSAILASSRATRASRLLEETILSANPYRNGSTIGIVNILDGVAQRVTTELVDEPALAAELHYKLGQTYANLWQWEKAHTHATAAVSTTRALSDCDELILATRLVLLGRAMTFRGVPRAVEIQREALAIRIRRLGERHFDVGDSKVCLAFAMRSQPGVPPLNVAERFYKDGIATLKKASSGPTQRLAIALLSYSSMLSSMQRNAEAAALMKEAWETYRVLPVHEDRYWIACQFGYALVLARADRIDEAREIFEDAVRRVPVGLEDTFPKAEYTRLMKLIYGDASFISPRYNEQE